MSSTAAITLRAKASERWSTVHDVAAAVRAAWQSGRLARAHTVGDPLTPLVVTLHRPVPGDLATDLSGVRDWAAALSRASRGGSTRPRFAIEQRSIGGRDVGANRVPVRVRFEHPEQLWHPIGVEAELAVLDDVIAQTSDRHPHLLDWVAANPFKAIEAAGDWPALLDAVAWICTNAHRQIYLRQIAAPGVDTKLLERHHMLVAALLDLTLPPQRINQVAPRRDLAARYGFRTRPAFVRSRMLDGHRWISESIGDCYLQVDDLAELTPPAEQVIIVENEICYLTLPALTGCLALFGKGYDVARFALLPWLHTLPVTYWGDLDTHGFAILDQLRRHVPHVKSALMDVQTLLAHRRLWGREPQRAPQPPTRLTSTEFQAFDRLLEEADDHARPVRLEQEHLPMDVVLAGLAHCGVEGADSAR